MPAYPRHEIVTDDQIGVYHCVTRCVRRSFLCGFDPITGKNHDHRKSWIRGRLQKLASVFGLDVCGYAVMSNHLHVVLRIRSDLVGEWTDEEIASRWLRLYPPRDQATGRPTEPGEHDLSMITSRPARVAQLRLRLASFSWFMRCLNEPIARAANREDKCTGRFWEGRFKSQALLDEAAILACSVYDECAELGVEGRFPVSFRRFWNGWASTRRAASRLCGTLAVCSSERSAV